MTLIHAEKNAGRKPPAQLEDPVLAMLGVGQQLWEHEAGDRFIERLRSEDLSIPQVRRQAATSTPTDLSDAVWRVI